MQKSKAEKIILVLLVLGGVLYGYYRYFLVSQLNEIKRLESEVLSKNESYKSVIEIRKDTEGFEKKLEEKQEELKSLNKKILNEDDKEQFNMDIYNYLKEHQLKTINNDPKQKDKTDEMEYNQYALFVRISGKKENIIEFIKYLKGMERKVRISNFALKVLNSEEWEAEMDVEIFYMDSEIKMPE